MQNNIHKNMQCLGLLMHRFSCRTEMQLWPPLLGVAQGNLAGSLEEQAKCLAGGCCCGACGFHFGI